MEINAEIKRKYSMKDYKKNVEVIKTLNRHYTKISYYYMGKCVSRPNATYQENGLLILSNEINELSKSLLYLSKNDAILGIDSLNRDILERYIYIKQIMSNADSAKAYFLKGQLTELDLLLKIKGIKTYQSKSKDITEYQNAISNMMNKPIQEIQKHFDNNSGKVSKEAEIKIIEEYKSCFSYPIADDHIFMQKWYNFNSKTKNLEKLARENNLIDEYLTLYSFFSSEVHSSNSSGTRQTTEVKGRVFLGFLEKPEAKSGLTFAINYLRESIKILLDSKNMPKKFKRSLDEELYKIMSTSNFVNS